MSSLEQISSDNGHEQTPNQAVEYGLELILDELSTPRGLEIMQGSTWLADRAQESLPWEAREVQQASQALALHTHHAAKYALELVRRDEAPFCDMPPIDDPGPIALQRVDVWGGRTVSLPARSTGSPRWSDIYRVSVEYRGTNEGPLIEHARLQIRLPNVFISPDLKTPIRSITIEAGLFEGKTGAMDELTTRHALAVRYRLPGAVRSATALLLTSQQVGELPPDDDVQFPARIDTLQMFDGRAVFDNPRVVASLLDELAVRLLWAGDELRAASGPTPTQRKRGR